MGYTCYSTVCGPAGQTFCAMVRKNKAVGKRFIASKGVVSEFSCLEVHRRYMSSSVKAFGICNVFSCATIHTLRSQILHASEKERNATTEFISAGSCVCSYALSTSCGNDPALCTSACFLMGRCGRYCPGSISRGA